MATHSSVLAWRIPGMGEPGGLQSMGSLRVGHDWATSLSLSLSCIGEGNGNPLWCSYLENPRDQGAWWAAVSGVAQSRTRLKRLSSSSSSIYINTCVCVSHSVVSDSLWPHELSRFHCPWNSPGKNTGVGCHSLLQEIFLTHGSNLSLPCCRQILYHLSHHGSPINTHTCTNAVKDKILKRIIGINYKIVVIPEEGRKLNRALAILLTILFL